MAFVSGVLSTPAWESRYLPYSPMPLFLHSLTVLFLEITQSAKNIKTESRILLCYPWCVGWEHPIPLSLREDFTSRYINSGKSSWADHYRGTLSSWTFPAIYQYTHPVQMLSFHCGISGPDWKTSSASEREEGKQKEQREGKRAFLQIKIRCNDWLSFSKRSASFYQSEAKEFNPTPCCHNRTSSPPAPKWLTVIILSEICRMRLMCSSDCAASTYMNKL